MGSRDPKNPPKGVSRQGALDAVPEKSREVEEARLDSGTVVLSYPVTLKPFFEKLAARFSREPGRARMRKLALDRPGTWVWDRLDASLSVRELAALFRREFDVLESEAEASVTRFLYELGRRGLIGLR